MGDPSAVEKWAQKNSPFSQVELLYHSVLGRSTIIFQNIEKNSLFQARYGRIRKTEKLGEKL